MVEKFWIVVSVTKGSNSNPNLNTRYTTRQDAIDCASAMARKYGTTWVVLGAEEEVTLKESPIVVNHIKDIPPLEATASIYKFQYCKAPNCFRRDINDNGLCVFHSTLINSTTV